MSFQLLARHSELEQSETKAQGALVTVLSLTQITELKLLLDLGRQGHRFYSLVLAMLITCISLEIFIGIIIIYIGNLHYYKTSTGLSFCNQLINCLTCNCARAMRSKRGPGGAGGQTPGGYVLSHESVRLSSRAGISGHHQLDDELIGCFDPSESRMESTFGSLDRTGSSIEFARMKKADANLKIARAENYVSIVEEAARKSPGNSELDKELSRAREDLAAALRDKEEAEAEQRLAEAQQNRLLVMTERQADWQAKVTFRKISLWQHAATYLLYFVLLLNVFITTFGISTGSLLEHPSLVAASTSPTMRTSHNTTHL